MFNRSVDVDEETMEHEIFSMDEEEDAVELLDKTERERGKIQKISKEKKPNANRLPCNTISRIFLKTRTFGRMIIRSFVY